jgi:hypothetical protein
LNGVIPHAAAGTAWGGVAPHAYVAAVGDVAICTGNPRFPPSENVTAIVAPALKEFRVGGVARPTNLNGQRTPTVTACERPFLS